MGAYQAKKTLFFVILLQGIILFAMPNIAMADGNNDGDVLSDVMGNDVKDTPPLSDNYEAANRYILEFNLFLDRLFVRPVAKGLRKNLPYEVRRSFKNFFTNLSEPLNSLNSLLQGNHKTAASSMGRFLLNSTAGIGGLFDPASDLGLKYMREDFGQTFAKWGIGDGGYIVLPVFGPHTLRSAVGLIPAYFLDPYNIYMNKQDSDMLQGGLRYTELVINRSYNYHLLENAEKY